MKKSTIIILSAVTLVIVTTCVAGGLWLVNTIIDKPVTSNNVAKESFTPDLSEDLGACKLLSSQAIASSFSVDVSKVGSAVDKGIIYYSGGLKSQRCEYQLDNDATLVVQILKLNDEKLVTDTKATLSKNSEYKVTTINDELAYFSNNKSTIILFKGTDQIDLSINKNNKQTKLNTESLLQSLASSID